MSKIEFISWYLKKARQAYERGSKIYEASGKTLETVEYDDLFWEIINKLKIALWGEEICDWIDWRLLENGSWCSFGNDTDNPREYTLKSDEDFIEMLNTEYSLSDEIEDHPAWYFQKVANKKAEEALKEDDLYTAEDFAEYFEKFIKTTVAKVTKEEKDND